MVQVLPSVAVKACSTQLHSWVTVNPIPSHPNTGVSCLPWRSPPRCSSASWSSSPPPPPTTPIQWYSIRFPLPQPTSPSIHLSPSILASTSQVVEIVQGWGYDDSSSTSAQNHHAHLKVTCPLKWLLKIYQGTGCPTKLATPLFFLQGGFFDWSPLKCLSMELVLAPQF